MGFWSPSRFGRGATRAEVSSSRRPLRLSPGELRSVYGGHKGAHFSSKILTLKLGFIIPRKRDQRTYSYVTGVLRPALHIIQNNAHPSARRHCLFTLRAHRRHRHQPSVPRATPGSSPVRILTFARGVRSPILLHLPAPGRSGTLSSSKTSSGRKFGQATWQGSRQSNQFTV